MPPHYQPPQLDWTTSSTPSSPLNPTNNEGGGVVSKWRLEEVRRLVKSWTNVSTNPLIGADQKKSGFWTKVTHIYIQHPPSGASKRTSTVCNARWNRSSSSTCVQVVCLCGPDLLGKPKWGKRGWHYPESPRSICYNGGHTLRPDALVGTIEGPT